MFSRTADYALRTIVFLAAQEGPKTTPQIAAATQVPVGYLSKVLRLLGRTGLLSAQPGLHGGFVLAQDPTTLTVYDVIQAVDPLPRILHCPLGRKHAGGNLCRLHQRLDDAVGLVENALRNSTVMELVDPGTASNPLCNGPKVGGHGKAEKTVLSPRAGGRPRSLSLPIR